MGCDKPENLPARTSLQAFDDLALSIRQSGAVDCNSVMQGGFSSGNNVTSFPFVSVPAARPLPRNFDDTDNFLMPNLKNLNTLHHHQLEKNLINVRNIAPSSTPSEMQHSMAQIYHSNMNNNMPTSNSFLKEGALPTEIENPGHSMNFMPMRSNVAGFNPAAEEAGKATGIRKNSLQASGSPLDTGHIIQNTKNVAGIGLHNDVKVSPVHFSSPENIDGSFLTLGIASNMEDRSKVRTSGKELRSILEEGGLPQVKSSHVQQMRRNFTVQGVPGGITNFHHDSGGLPNSSRNLGLSTLSSNNNEVMVAPDSSISATPFIYLGSPPDMRLNSSNSGVPGAVGKAGLRYSETDFFKCPHGDFPPSLPCSSNSTFTPHLGHAKMAASLESAQPAWVAAQPTITQQQNCYTNISRNQYFKESPILIHGGSQTVKQDQLGQQPINVPNPWGNNPIHERIGSQIAGWSGIQPAADQFPKRLGVHLNDGATSQASREGIVTGTGGILQIRTGNSHHSPDNGPAIHPTALLQPPLTIGQPRRVSPAQFNVSGAPYHAAQGIQISKDEATPQASSTHGHTSLKRRANGALPIAPVSQRRRTLAQLNQHIALQRQTFNARVPASSTSLPSPNVKWQGLEESAEPIGEKCLLCKRDVSFAPEGPVARPAVLPAVAVLPCGHVFHDHCLQIITPQDQSKDPPCIPCALGET